MYDHEIRDVNRRASQPTLDLSATDTVFNISGQSLAEVRVQFRVFNGSTVAASFASITMGIFWGASVSFPTTTDWQWVEVTDRVKIARCVVASGTSNVWSPVTPGFTLVVPWLTLRVPILEQDAISPRVVGLARLDHDGGTAVARLVFWRQGTPGTRIRLEPGTGDALERITNTELDMPAFFDPRLSKLSPLAEFQDRRDHAAIPHSW